MVNGPGMTQTRARNSTETQSAGLAPRVDQVKAVRYVAAQSADRPASWWAVQGKEGEVAHTPPHRRRPTDPTRHAHRLKRRSTTHDSGWPDINNARHTEKGVVHEQRAGFSLDGRDPQARRGHASRPQPGPGRPAGPGPGGTDRPIRQRGPTSNGPDSRAADRHTAVHVRSHWPTVRPRQDRGPARQGAGRRA